MATTTAARDDPLDAGRGDRVLSSFTRGWSSLPAINLSPPGAHP